MENDKSADSPKEALSVRSDKQLQHRASLIKRGLATLVPFIDPTTISRSNATIIGQCVKARKNYGPPEFPGTRRFFFVCGLENTTDYRQCPGKLRIFLRSRRSNRLNEASDAMLDMVHLDMATRESKYSSIDLAPHGRTIARLEFLRTFPISRPTGECQDELFGDGFVIGNGAGILGVVSGAASTPRAFATDMIAINTIAVSSDGRFLAAGNSFGAVEAWELR